MLCIVASHLLRKQRTSTRAMHCYYLYNLYYTTFSAAINPFASKRGLTRTLRLLFILVAKYSSDVRVHV